MYPKPEIEAEDPKQQERAAYISDKPIGNKESDNPKIIEDVHEKDASHSDTDAEDVTLSLYLWMSIYTNWNRYFFNLQTVLTAV